MRILFLHSILLFVHIAVSAQITGIESAWRDSFREWNIFALDAEDDEIEGQLRMRWAMNDDWSEWDYRIGEDFGAIKVKWKGNLNQWEVRGGNEIINVQTIYRDDPSQWRLRSGNQILTLKLNRRDVPFDWRVDHPDLGFYEIYTEWEEDPRSWIIVDEMSSEISVHMKMAIIFFSTFSSTPRI